MNENVVFALLIAGVVVFWALLCTFIIMARKKREKAAASMNRPAPAAFAPKTPDFVFPKEDLDRILERIAEKTRRESLRATLKEEPAPSLFSSKVGGLPYWDLRQPYPCDREGHPLVLLAQINMSELPENDVFPQEGLLQFFVLPDSLYGMDCDAHDDQNGFCVIFHETVDPGITEDDIRALDPPTSFTVDEEQELPHQGEFAMEFRKEEVCLGADDYNFDDELRRTAEELSLVLPENFSMFQATRYDHSYDEWWRRNQGTRLLGYPFFTQEDPRPADSPYDTLLFQLDSYFVKPEQPGSTPERFVMWGDSGVANFFIRHEDLAEKRFDRVYYTWDCY